jgi:hypothetical protein
VDLLPNILVGGIDVESEEIMTERKQFEPCQSEDMLTKLIRARMGIIPIQDLIPDIDKRVISRFFSFF